MNISSRQVSAGLDGRTDMGTQIRNTVWMRVKVRSISADANHKAREIYHFIER